VDSHRQFAGEHELPFLLLADEDGEVADRYGALRNLLVTRLARRHTFVIDPERRIAARFLNVDPDDHSADVIRFLEQVTADPD
jgi:peroxiredoxin Q/BCP